MSLYTVAYLVQDGRLLACVPDGSDPQPLIEQALKDKGIDLELDAVSIQIGTTLTDDIEPEARYDLVYAAGTADALKDADGRRYKLAVRR